MTGDAVGDAYRLMLTQVTVEKLADMVIWLDETGRYVFVNPAATKLLGYTAEELSRMHVWEVDPLFDEARWRAHWDDVVERKSFIFETVNTSKSGLDITIEVTVNFVEHEGRRFNCAIIRDVTERRRLDRELRDLNETIYRMSITDSLTGVANRRHFDTVLGREMERHGRSGVPLSLILLDVDAFKALNDTYGHVVGDDALRSLRRPWNVRWARPASRPASAVRSSPASCPSRIMPKHSPPPKVPVWPSLASRLSTPDRRSPIISRRASVSPPRERRGRGPSTSCGRRTRRSTGPSTSAGTESSARRSSQTSRKAPQSR